MNESFAPDQEYLHDVYLDQDIAFTANGTTNREPLFIASVYTYSLLPNATITEIPNLFLAADYVKGKLRKF